MLAAKLTESLVQTALGAASVADHAQTVRERRGQEQAQAAGGENHEHVRIHGIPFDCERADKDLRGRGKRPRRVVRSASFHSPFPPRGALLRAWVDLEEGERCACPGKIPGHTSDRGCRQPFGALNRLAARGEPACQAHSRRACLGGGGGEAVTGKARLRTNATSEKQPPAGKCLPVGKGTYEIGAPGTTPADRLSQPPTRCEPGSRQASERRISCVRSGQTGFGAARDTNDPGPAVTALLWRAAEERLRVNM